MAIPRDICSCGEAKPATFATCWRCIDRDPVFALLDTLIAMGKGHRSRDLLPASVIADALANPRKPTRRDYRDESPTQTTARRKVARLYAACPECQCPDYAWRSSSRKNGKIYLRCTACGNYYAVPMIEREECA